MIVHSIFNELIPFLPEVSIIIFALFALIFGLYRNFSKAIWWIASLWLFFLLCIIYKNPLFITNGYVLGGLVNSGISIWLKSIVLTFTILILLFYGGMNRVKVWSHAIHEFVIIILLATVGAMLTISARNFIILYLALELVSLSSYILAAYDRELPYSGEAGIKYLILGSLSSCIMVFGLSYIYGFSGSLMYHDVEILLLKNLYSPGLIVGITLLVVGVLFKLSIVPFHFWTPDIYQGAPFISVAFFTTIPKVAAIAALINIINHVILPIQHLWINAFIFIAILSMLVGALGAIQQNSFKRLIGYSTILNMGFILLALSVGTTKGFASAIMYQILYSFSSLGLFATLAITISPDAQDYKISILSGFGLVKKLAAFSISVFMFSLVGIPPLAGFFAKFYIISSILNEGLYIASILAVFITVIAAYYYINIIRIMYFSPPAEKQLRLHESSALVFIITLCTVIVMLFPLVQYMI